MTRLSLFTSFWIVLFLFYSCNEHSTPIITTQLVKSDFTDNIEVNGTVEAVNITTIKTPRTISFNCNVKYLAKHGERIRKGDTVAILSTTETYNSIEQYNNQIESIKEEIKRKEYENSANKNKLLELIENNQAQILLNSLDSIQRKFAPPLKQKILDLQLKKANLEKEKLRKKLSAQISIGETEVRRLKMRITQTEGRIKMDMDQNNSLRIVSPVDGIAQRTTAGIITFTTSSESGITMGQAGGEIKEGSSVFANMNLLQVPDISKMQVNVNVPEADYKKIEPGQQVYISVQWAGNLQTTGEVIRKSLAGQTQDFFPRNSSNVKNYNVLISVDSCHTKMPPGTTARCKIVINQIRDTIVVPSIAIFQEDSIKTIYVKKGEKFSPTTVETGISNEIETIITKGLTGNEWIALLKPSQNQIEPSVTTIHKNKKSNKIK